MSAEWDAFYKRTSSALDSFKSEFAKRPATPSQSYTPKTITNEQFVRDSSGSQRNDEPIKSYNSKTNTMSNLLNKIPGLNFSFGTLEKGLVALSLNGDLAFRTKDGGYMTLQVDENGNKKQIAVGDLKMDVPFYTLPTQTLEVDDLVLMDGKILVVQEKPSTGGIKFVDPLTGNTSSKIAQGNILNMYFYTKIVSMFNLAGGQTGGIGLGGLNPMTLMLLSGDGGIGSGDNSFVEAMVLSQVMGAGAAGGQAINPMMLMLLSKDSNGGGGLFGGNSMLPLLMMSGGAQGGANPFGNLFGAPAQIAAPAVKTAKGAAKTAVKKTAKKVAPAKRAYVKKG